MYTCLWHPCIGLGYRIQLSGSLLLDFKHNAANTNFGSMNEGSHLHLGEAIAIPSDVIREAIAIPKDSTNNPGSTIRHWGSHCHTQSVMRFNQCMWDTSAGKAIAIHIPLRIKTCMIMISLSQLQHK